MVAISARLRGVAVALMKIADDMRPIIINNVLHSARILGHMCEKVHVFSIEGTELDTTIVSDYAARSLALGTALSPYIGYDKASAISDKADDDGTSLRDAALALGVSAGDFDRIVVPKNMVGNPRRDLRLEQPGSAT